MQTFQPDIEDLFRQAPIFFAVLRGPTHVFERANDAYLQLVGHRDILGKPLLEALPEIAGQGFVELLDEVIDTGKPFIARGMPASVQRSAGAPPEDVWVDFVYHPLRAANGTVDGVIVVGSDVTKQFIAVREAEAKARALAASEEQLVTAVNSIPTLAWMANADGWIFWYNARWYQYTGTTPEAMEGWGWQSVHDPEILPSVLERWTLSIATGEPFEMEFPLRSSSGEFRWFLTRVSPLFDANGEIVRWFGTNTDVHSQREAADAAQAANQAKSNFLAAMSHETRQPINATLGFVEVLEMEMYGPLNEEQKKALARIRLNQEQLRTVVTDVLTFARLDVGQVQLEHEMLQCHDLLADIPSLTEPQMAARQVSMRVEPCDETLITRGDRNHVLQICTNLLTNALRASEKGGAITMRCRARDEWVDIEVEDAGTGIPADKLEQIFAPFVQLDRGLNRPREGVGLGLAISRDLARAMGGELTVKSAVGEGSTFTLSLPGSATPGNASARDSKPRGA